MKMHIFAVYDSKAEFYGNPFFMSSVGEAIRGFQDVSIDKNTNIGRHPGDFTLFHLGEFETSYGEWTIYDTKKSLGTALEHRPAEKQPQFELVSGEK